MLPPLPKLATEPFLKLWEQEVFALLMAEGKITEDVVANMRSWKHSGFSVDQSVRLDGEDHGGVVEAGVWARTGRGFGKQVPGCLQTLRFAYQRPAAEVDHRHLHRSHHPPIAGSPRPLPSGWRTDANARNEG